MLADFGSVATDNNYKCTDAFWMVTYSVKLWSP